MDHSKTKSSNKTLLSKRGSSLLYRLAGKDLLPGPARRAGLADVLEGGRNWEGSKNWGWPIGGAIMGTAPLGPSSLNVPCGPRKGRCSLNGGNQLSLPLKYFHTIITHLATLSMAKLNNTRTKLCEGVSFTHWFMLSFQKDHTISK